MHTNDAGVRVAFARTVVSRGLAANDALLSSVPAAAREREKERGREGERESEGEMRTRWCYSVTILPFKANTHHTHTHTPVVVDYFHSDNTFNNMYTAAHGACTHTKQTVHRMDCTPNALLAKRAAHQTD